MGVGVSPLLHALVGEILGLLDGGICFFCLGTSI